jgi:hypothetical protein
MAQNSTINNLYRRYGLLAATTTDEGGEPSMVGDIREVTFDLDLTDLTETETILFDNIFFPASVRVKEVEVFTEVAAVTGTAIDLGLINRDRSTEVDYNGFLAAFATASMNAVGEKQTLTNGSATVGALVGTTIATGGYLSASRTDATAFTAGNLKITIRYYRP